MAEKVRRLARELSQSLGFVPGLFVVVFAAAGIALVEIDARTDLEGSQWVFQGDGSAARTVLSVIAGSLITVAGLTFSITMVVLQLASSQFSPRVLRTFFGDRMTQATIGTFVGTFVYAILVLRAVGSFGDTGFVPRLSVTLASLLGIVAVIVLIVFLNHVSRMVQVSHVVAGIAHDTLARAQALFPSGYGEPDDEAQAGELLREWREAPPGRVCPERPGYVLWVDLDGLVSRLGDRAERVAVLVCPGDFAAPDRALAEIWPAEVAEDCEDAVRDSIAIADERDLEQDPAFGIRQLADVALKAMSPGINDPATAVTCIGYLRAILVRLTTRAWPPSVRRFPDAGLVVIARRRAYDEHLDSVVQVGRYAAADAWVAGELLRALLACEAAAIACDARQRLGPIRDAAGAIAEQAAREAPSGRDRDAVQALLARFGPGEPAAHSG